MASLTPEADIIIVACSQDATTRGFVNSAFLSACKAGVIIVNVARGEVRARLSPFLAVDVSAQGAHPSFSTYFRRPNELRKDMIWTCA